MACISKRRGRLVIDFYDQTGKRRWETLLKGTTKKKARDRLREIEVQVEKRVFIPTKKIPLFSEAAKDWLEHKKPNLRITTWEVYESQVRNHFAAFNDLKLNMITTATVEKYISERQKEGMHIGTLRKVLITLNQILRYAVRHRYIDHNPLNDAERPRATGNGELQDALTILTREQAGLLLQKTEDQKYRMLFMLAIFTGARQGELLGLKWDDIDWKTGQVHFQRTFNSDRFFSPKTTKSNRKVTIGPQVLTQLKKWKLACPKSQMDLVFPNKAGEPVNRNNMINRYFRPALKNSGLPNIRFHDLRHTYASIRLDGGDSIAEVSEDLGHSRPTVTLNVYTHKLRKSNPEAARRLEEEIFNATGSKMVAARGKEAESV